ncbi:MAG: NAD(P)H-dependent oxidoreductase [Flavobacteriales bacterium]|nr:NAD(P)H-dependent oxidoreductase [Flavobacteriales bacterium]
MKLIENLKWRYATKKYDASKKLREEDLAKIKEVIQLSASSYGLQLFKVLDVKSTELRAELKTASWGQSQITDASQLFVFCNYADVKEEHIEEYIQLKAELQGLDINSLTAYGDFVKGKMKEKSIEEKQVWMAKQSYIALSSALAACAELKIDSTPMEGFEPDAYDKILGLKEKGLKASVVLAIGYRSDEDLSQHGKKVRKPISSIFESI